MPYIRYVESRRPLLVAALLFTCASITACAHRVASPKSQAPPSGTMASKPALIPWPVSVALNDTERFGLDKDLVIEVSPNQPQLQRIGQELSNLLRPALDVAIPVRPLSPTTPNGAIRFEIGSPGADAGDEGYELTITATGVRLLAATPAGMFYGVQTFRQLLPASVEWRAARPHALSVATGRIADRPRFGWRGAMLDVARHFFGARRRQALHRPDGALQAEPPAPAPVRRPGLAHRDQVLAEPHGTRRQHRGRRRTGRVLHAGGVPRPRRLRGDRFITVVPEIDMPGHTNAALASYPELNCDGVAPPLYTGIEVGFSTFCVDKDITYKFIDDVVREMAALTPGPYIPHRRRRGEEAHARRSTRSFIERVQDDRASATARR